jgi:mannose-1-phosphate guanylyltransferase / phosphomannomutase
MKAVVMAGGLGSRLRPLTTNCPKTMLPLVNKPVLGHILGWLKQHRVQEVFLAVGHLSGQIRNYVGDGRRLGLNVRYVEEDVPLGTAGSIKNARPYLGHEPFLVISGDVVSDIDLGRLYRFHREKEALVTLALTHIENPRDCGVVGTDARGRINYFEEKPAYGARVSSLINTGIYVLDPAMVDAYIQPGLATDFSYHVFPQIVRQRGPIFGYTGDFYWQDIGTIPNYLKATADLLSGKLRGVELGRYLGGGVWAGRNVEIATSARLYGPVYLGHCAKIGSGAVIHGPAVVGNGVVIDRDATIDQSIIGQRCFIGHSARLRQAIVPERCSVAASSFAPVEVVVAPEGDPQQVPAASLQPAFYVPEYPVTAGTPPDRLAGAS